MLCYRICVVDLTGYCSTFNIQIYSKSKTDLQNCNLNCNFQGGHHLLDTNTVDSLESAGLKFRVFSNLC